jgi:TetR/AcrR family acrAB operon transcriptional repressor
MRAAAEVIGERGFRQATIAEIADRAGISRGSIPWHFGNKEGLLAAVIEQFIEDMADRFVVDEPGSPRDIGGALDAAMLFVQLPETRLLIMVMAEAIEEGSSLAPWYAKVHAAMRAQLRDWVRPRDLPAGVTADGWATVVMAAMMGIHQQWRLSPDTVDLDQAASALRAFVLSSLRSPARGRSGVRRGR